MLKKRQKIARIIERYKQELKNFGIKVRKVILFGSYATGRQKRYSDIDLVVISEDFRKLNLRERLELLGSAAGKLFEPIEALGYTPKELKTQRKESFLGEILHSTTILF